MNDLRSSRTTALTALPVTVAAALYAGAGAITGWAPALGWLIQAVIHIGELGAVVALALAGAAGSGRAARIGLGAAMLGQAVLVVAEVVEPGDPDLGDTLFGVGPVLTGVGLLVAGTAALRAGQGLGRLTPIALGTYTLVVLIPVLIGSGGPPAAVAVWAICGWDLLWSLVAVSVLTRTAAVRIPVSG